MSSPTGSSAAQPELHPQPQPQPHLASMPLLRTKLFLPPAPEQAVTRAHLLQRLDAGRQRRLTLISAPAGFGKTTLARAWIASMGSAAEGRTAWLALDANDNDPVRFLAYLVAALQTVAPTVGGSLSTLASDTQPQVNEVLLTTLINDLVAHGEPLLLVLDDYHVIENAAVDQALAFLVEHLPPNLHLVITTRQDPPLPLARLRARNQITDVRASDLRFSRAEVATYLNAVIGLHLTDVDIAALEARTEGWIAGLQLAVLSLQGQPDVPAFIRAFAGDHRYIADYLIDEVLQQQPPAERAFLLQTSILERLHGPLCDAVTNQPSGSQTGAARLERLARSNAFVIPLDDRSEGGWYRYHHLFADVLRAHLQHEQPDILPTLHRRASEWYQRNGQLDAAIQHALAADDPEFAADLIEAALPALRRGRMGTTLRGWLRTMPDAVLSERPVLSVAYAWALMAAGEFSDVLRRLDDAERWITPEHAGSLGHTSAATSASPFVGAEREAEFRRLPGVIASYRAALVLLQGNPGAARTYAQLALEHTPADEPLVLGSAGALLGITLWFHDDLAGAVQHYSAGIAHLDRAGMLPDVINAATTLAAMRIAQGKLREAQRILEQALQRASEQPAPQALGIADFHVGLAEIALAQDDRDAAAAHLQRSQQLVDELGAWRDHARWHVALAQLRAAQDDPQTALTLLDEAERQQGQGVNFFPNLRPVPAQRARIWLAQGRIDDARDWAQSHAVTMHDERSYLREFEHITLARLLLADATRQSSPDRAALTALLDFLQRLLPSADAGQHLASVIDLLVLQALVQHARGDTPAALATLQRALTNAEPEGFVLPFVDAGVPLRALLQLAAQQANAPRHASRVLAAFSETSTRPAAPRLRPQAAEEPDALSERELDVLRLLASDLSGPDIAAELSVSLNTLRTHTKNIYSKLDVNSRRAAVSRAAERGLLTHGRTHHS